SIKATTKAGHLLTSTLGHAEEALNELNDALAQMNNANDSMQNIAAVAEEQAAACKEVAQAIDGATRASIEMAGTVSNVHRVTDETTRSTEGIARQANGMKVHAQTLAELLSMFKLESAQPAMKYREGQ
ncbi:MAG: hypothetical protein FWG09_01630, partial [Synergistaceae bacterium]|nr:hypothetical protein [Synergistaceae bacterium]